VRYLCTSPSAYESITGTLPVEYSSSSSSSSSTQLAEHPVLHLVHPQQLSSFLDVPRAHDHRSGPTPHDPGSAGRQTKKLCVVVPPPGDPADTGTGFPACTGSVPASLASPHTFQYLPSHSLQFLFTLLFIGPHPSIYGWEFRRFPRQLFCNPGHNGYSLFPQTTVFVTLVTMVTMVCVCRVPPPPPETKEIMIVMC
jgi:hypothetical protein